MCSSNPGGERDQYEWGLWEIRLHSHVNVKCSYLARTDEIIECTLWGGVLGIFHVSNTVAHCALDAFNMELVRL